MLSRNLEKTLHRLAAIPGQPIAPYEVEAGCAFAPRCSHATQLCLDASPAFRRVGIAGVACHHAERVAANASDPAGAEV